MEVINHLNEILHSFKINATCVGYQQIENYFYYDLKLNPNARVRDLVRYSEEISLAMKTPCKPNVKVLRKEGLIRLEFLTPRTKKMNLMDIFTNRSIPNGEINCLLGKTVDGNKMWMDLSQNPHMIIAGSTGSGKSVLLHNIIANLLNYNNTDIYLVDPKNIEFGEYENKISNIKVSYSFEEALALIRNMTEIMNFRYSLLRAGKSAVEFKSIVIIIDEFADLIMQDKDHEFHFALCQLAQKCRASKIHIILATQRPSVDVINGTIKANFPVRIACRVASHVDSKVILDSSGAENLLGKGDAFLRDANHPMERFQVAYASAKEICSIYGDQ